MKSFRRLACIAFFLSAVMPTFAFAQNNPTVVLETNRGNIFIELFPTEAPITVDNFLAYVNEGFYDGLLFHRVIEGFMIQGGGYYFDGTDFYEVSTGPPIVNESYNGLSNLRGTIAMARTDDPNSATSEFFINQVDNLSLDRQGASAGYCVFGKVSYGLDVVDTIATSPVADYYPEYSYDPFNNIPVPLIGIYAAHTVPTIPITKCTVTAGSKDNSDKISFSGTMDAEADDFNDADTVEVTIVSDDIVNPCVLNFPINDNTFKKGKYSYSGTESGIKKSFAYDIKTGKFTFAAANVDLSGLACPLTVRIEINSYIRAAEVDETVVNGPKKPIPIQLMMGVKDVLRVDKCTVKQNDKKPDSDQLSVKGAFAVEDTGVNMVNEEFVVTLGAQTFTLPVGSFKANKGGFTCTKADVTEDDSIAAATFNFNLCSFTLAIKNTNIDVISGDVDFGVAFADYNEVDQVTLP